MKDLKVLIEGDYNYVVFVRMVVFFFVTVWNSDLMLVTEYFDLYDLYWRKKIFVFFCRRVFGDL